MDDDAPSAAILLRSKLFFLEWGIRKIQFCSFSSPMQCYNTLSQQISVSKVKMYLLLVIDKRINKLKDKKQNVCYTSKKRYIHSVYGYKK